MSTFGSSLSVKPSNAVRIYLENTSDLNMMHKAKKLSCKYHRLCRLQTRLDVDLINLVGTKINPVLLSKEADFKDNQFQYSINHTMFVNKLNKLLELKQQCGVLSFAREEIPSVCIGSGTNLLNLGR